MIEILDQHEPQFRKRLLISALCIGLSACGAIDEPTVQEGGESASDTTTTTLLLPPDSSVDKKVVPVVEDPVALVSTNRNDPSTSIGALCWARWEASRVVLSQVMKPMVVLTEDPRAAQIDTDIRAAIERASDSQLREFVMAGDLPAEVDQFADAMFRMFDETLAATEGLEIVAIDDIETVLDFEGLPGADEYMNHASESKECVNP